MRNTTFLLIILLLGLLSSCTDGFENLNTDKKHPQEVTAAVIFTNVEIELADQISTPNVRNNFV